MGLVVIEIKELKSIIASTINETMRQQKELQQIEVKTEFLTRNQAAKLLGVCLATIDNWTKQGRLTKHRINSVVRYKKSELLDSMQTIEKYKR